MSELAKSLSKAQQEINAPIKDKINPRFKSSYASIDSIYAAVRGPLHKNGLNLRHEMVVLDGKNFLKSTLMHDSGEEISIHMPMFIENNTNQSFGSSLTYISRYATCALLSLPSVEDDDGEAAENPTLSSKQIEEIMTIIGKDTDLLTRLLNSYGKKSLEEIPLTEYGFIIKKLNVPKKA